jgi:hypothetical protein
VGAGQDFLFLVHQLATTGKLGSLEQGYRIGLKSPWLLGGLDRLLLRVRKTNEQLR